MSIGKIAFVHIAGEQDSFIRDETQTDDDETPKQQSVTFYEDTVYRLHVQVDCNGQWARGGNEYSCDLSQNVNLWIDFNDRGFSDVANQVTLRSWPDSSTQGGAYDLELRIPVIDGREVISGPHRMRISLVPTERYRRECGSIDLNEVREYTANIVPRARQIAAYQPPLPRPAPQPVVYQEVYQPPRPAPQPVVYQPPYQAVYRTPSPVIYPGKDL